MALVDSLLTSIVRANGDALVMHVGEKPFVVGGARTIDLPADVLRLDGVAGILKQLLPADAQVSLQEFGAVTHRLPSSGTDDFTVVAGRAGTDLWMEIRRRRENVVPPFAPAHAAQTPPVAEKCTLAPASEGVTTPKLTQHDPAINASAGRTLTIRPLPPCFARVFFVLGHSGERYVVNLVPLTCTCPDHKVRCASFPADDARRVCEHIYRRLSATRADQEYDPLVRAYLQYGREMRRYEVVDEGGTNWIGGELPGTGLIRVMAVLDGVPRVADYDTAAKDWDDFTALPPPAVASLALRVVRRIRAHPTA